MVVEVIGAILSNSLALLADAGRVLSDVISIGIALLAFKLGGKPPIIAKPMDNKRFEILAAVLNGVTLALVALYIFHEAAGR